VATTPTGTDGGIGHLRRAVGGASFAFVVGKGGTGKTTTAGALAVGFADNGEDTHLISTDPAHSVGDLFGVRLGGAPVVSACSPRLVLEEYDAGAHARTWIDNATASAAELIEGGTYLDREDVAGFSRLALPGLDEMMAVLRLADLAGGGKRVVVDTAPTGHTLRLLDASATHEGVADALRAMADKAATVASSFAGRQVRLRGEALIDELEAYVRTFRQLLEQAAFIVAARSDAVVLAETSRLAHALRQRRLHAVATVFTGGTGGTGGTGATGAGACFRVPLLPGLRGCDSLRRWNATLEPCGAAGATAAVASHTALAPARETAPDTAAAPAPGAAAAPDAGARRETIAGAQVDAGAAAPWLAASRLRLLLFAGKGGVGKSTCAAAVALELARSRDVLLCSTDPAGSLDDVLGAAAVAAGRAGPRLRVVQVDAGSEVRRLREAWHAEVGGALEHAGLPGDAALDRRVVEAIWQLAPPGIDEFAALAALLDAADTDETIVVDPAPTGHFLRLLTLPETALAWTRQLMRIVVKYRAAGMAPGAAEALLRTARALRALQQRLGDAERTGVFVVTLPEPMVRAETDRLIATLREGDVPVAAVIVNRHSTSSGAGGPPGPPVIFAPDVPAPVGADALRDFIVRWRIVT
jgi:arsenite/tail-anchored protein-transporting ATPase